jgi:hypothetical protein
MPSVKSRNIRAGNAARVDRVGDEDHDQPIGQIQRVKPKVPEKGFK